MPLWYLNSFILAEGLDKAASIGFGIFVCLALAILIFAFLFAFVFSGKRNLRRARENTDFNVRVYTYNYAEKTFYCFDKMNFKNAKQFDEEGFLSQFDRKDRYLVEDWLQKIAHGDPTSKFIQADIVLSRTKKTTSSMLELTSVNREKNLIHFDSHLLPYVYVTAPRPSKKPVVNGKKPSRKNAPKMPKKYLLSDAEAAQKFLSDKHFDNSGSLYYFHLYKKDTLLNEEDSQKLAALNDEICFVLARFLSKTRKLLRLSPTEEILIDVGSISRVMAMNVASTIETSLQQYLNTSDNPEAQNCSVAIGLTTGTLCQKNYALGCDQAQKMAEAIVKGFTKEKVLFYDETFFDTYKKSKAQRDEVKMVIKNATYRLYFTPTLDIQSGELAFYLLSVYPYGTSIQDFTDVLKIAKENKDGEKILLSSLKERITARCGENKAKIAVKTPFDSLESFSSYLPEGKKKNLSWILALEESDILTSNEDPSVIAERILKLKEKGYQIALVIDSPSSGLRTRILKTADYFFVPSIFTSQAADPERAKNDLRSIQDTYTLYHAPLLYSGLKDFDDIELTAHFGGQIFECEELALPSSKLQDLDPEKVKDILDDTKNLVPKSSYEINL